MESTEIGQMIKVLRKQRELTQMELAERIDVSFQQVQKYENGKTQITLQRLSEITKALDVPITVFFKEKSFSRVSDKPGSYSAQEDLLFRVTNEEAVFLKLFRKIRNKKVKDSILKLFKGIIELESEK